MGGRHRVAAPPLLAHCFAWRLASRSIRLQTPLPDPLLPHCFAWRLASRSIRLQIPLPDPPVASLFCLAPGLPLHVAAAMEAKAMRGPADELCSLLLAP